MSNRRAIVGIAAAALIAAGALVAPAFGASEQSARVAKRTTFAPRVAGGFTPAASDPRLAAIFARGGLDTGSFRFTPAETRRSRAVTVAVRARSNRGPAVTRVATADAGNVGLAPIAYSLGASVGWKRFAVQGDLAKVDLAGLPGSREGADVALSYAGNRIGARVKAAVDRPLGAGPKLVENAESYSLDVGGSYSLTRNLDVTAGLRYRSERERIARLDDDRRDSQAVYLGTAFRF